MQDNKESIECPQVGTQIMSQIVTIDLDPVNWPEEAQINNVW